MIGKLFANDGTNAALVIVLSGTVAALVARGPASFGHIRAGILSNPVPRPVAPGVREGLGSPTPEKGAA